MLSRMFVDQVQKGYRIEVSHPTNPQLNSELIVDKVVMDNGWHIHCHSESEYESEIVVTYPWHTRIYVRT